MSELAAGGGLLGPADDDFHPAPADVWWFHETCWFWFYVPDRGIGGWLYNWIRPNIGVSGGGCWVWDTDGHLHWEVPYYSNHHNLRLPEDRDLRDFRFPSGVHVQMLEPLTRYRLAHNDGDQIDLDLVFDAVHEPWVSASAGEDGIMRPHHLDQLGRVTGRLVLHGEEMPVDCLAIRDRTWAPRSERWREGGGYGYTNAAAHSGEAFLAVGTDQVRGYFADGGERRALVSGSREVLRRTTDGAPDEVLVRAVDDDGRALEARGSAISRMLMPIPGVHGLVWTTLMTWTINGVPAWGEDQEPWPIARWSRDRRSGLL